MDLHLGAGNNGDVCSSGTILAEANGLAEDDTRSWFLSAVPGYCVDAVGPEGGAGTVDNFAEDVLAIPGTTTMVLTET